jgi:hypothetical protein
MPETLQTALYRLLHDRRARDQFLAGRLESLGLEPSAQAHLRTIDPDELVAISAAIGRDLLRGNVEYDGGLRSTFPDLFAQLERAGHGAAALVERFVASPQYADSRQVPYGPRGISVEEAFFEFLRGDDALRAAGPHAVDLLTHEFLSGLLSILVLNRDPSFAVRTALIRDNGVARYAVQRYPLEFVRTLTTRPVAPDPSGAALFLYAAAPARFVRGPATPVTAALLEHGRTRPDALVAALAGQGVVVTVERLAALGEGLARLGVIA